MNINSKWWLNFAPFETNANKENHCLENAVALVHEVTNYKTEGS